jgi:peptidoglycan/xylan/chitin deacetylase (PgdA/CDA1 family)
VNNQAAPTNTAPTIALVVPASPVSGTITLNATVTDDKAGYTVQYSVDGTNLQSSSWSTTTVADGDHVVVATVTDSEGLTATSTATVTVKNTVVTPPTDPTKYNRALVSLTFDDGWKSIHDNGLPILKKYGLVSTHYINSQPTLDGYSGYNTPQDIKDLADAGNEIAWHTNTHTYDLVTATAAQRTEELTPTAAFLNMLLSINVHMTDNFAAPFGTQNADTAAAAKAAGFNSYRTTYDGYNAKGTTDFMNIKVKNVCGVAGLDACNMLATTPAEVAGWIAEAQAQNTWLVIVFHEVGEFSRATAQANGTFCDADPAEAGVLPDDCVADPSYAVTPANLDAELNAIKQSNIAVVTVQQAIAELKTQQ